MNTSKLFYQRKKNAESARKTRRRKKIYLKLLEKKVRNS